MPACQKCWGDAGYVSMTRGTSKAEEYGKLIDERKDSPCTPEEQCGEMHIVIQWVVGSNRCICGKVVESDN